MRNLLIPLIFSLLTLCHSRPSPENHPLLPSSRELGGVNSLYCDSWRLSVETHNAMNWGTPPKECTEFIKEYMFGPSYVSDSVVVAKESSTFARSIEVAGDGKDAWVFDVDDTLLSLAPFYYGQIGSETFNVDASYKSQIDTNAPALPASLYLYYELEKLGFTIFLLTGRKENMRQMTEDNLHLAGYRNWKRLILREPSDYDKPAIEYKSERRQKLVDEGYRIRGSSGDQWSDLLGYAVAERSFKLPNPMYYVP